MRLLVGDLLVDRCSRPSGTKGLEERTAAAEVG